MSLQKIVIQQSKTADTRTCDYSKVTKEQLISSSQQHISDIHKALSFFEIKLQEAANLHDYDKLSDIDRFYADFITGFKQTLWWDDHRKLNRHHINVTDGVPNDVNLVDVIEHIADCVMAGMARSGNVYDLKLSNEILQQAFQNTIKLLKSVVVVDTQV